MERKTATLAQLAEMAGGELTGDPGLLIHGVADFEGAAEGEITFLTRGRRERKTVTEASAIIVPQQMVVDRPAIKVSDPYLAVAIIHQFFVRQPFAATGIHPAAHIGKDCQIPAEVAIGPLAVLGNGVVLGERVTIHPGVVLGDGVWVGKETVLHPNVTVLAGCRLGARVIVHSGTVIGSDGFGYATDGQGKHLKRPQVGIVEIEDDVELGANVCVDRATFGKTVVRKGSKIDNLVQVAHNVEVGENCLLVSQVGIAGSTILGRNVVVGGQTGIAGHLEVGDRVMAGAKSGIHGSVAPGTVVSGIPAIPHKNWLRAVSAFSKLPELVKEVRTLTKRVALLTEQLGLRSANKS